MKVEPTSTTLTSTGETLWFSLEDYTLTPNYFRFTISPTSTSNATFSVGTQDIILDRKKANCIYVDGTLRETKRSTTESILAYKNVSGTLTKMLGAYVSDVEEGGFKITVNTITEPVLIDIEVIER